MSRSRVLVVILCYNGIELTLDCLRSLREGAAGTDVLVVDNASTDGTPQIVRERFPEVKVLESGANLGYAGGNNLGIAHALEQGYEFVLLLNNDTVVADGFLEPLLAACDANLQVGAAGPKVYYHDRPSLIYSIGGAVDWTRGASSMLGLNEVDAGQYDKAGLIDVDFVNGCALLMRSAAIRQCGMLDARFGMYYEETEWCVRLARAGWRICTVPASRIWHKISPQQQAVSPRVGYYMARNRLLFLRLTHAPLRAWVHAALLQDGRTLLSYSVRPKWRGQRAQRDAILRGWRDFLRGRYGMA